MNPDLVTLDTTPVTEALRGSVSSSRSRAFFSHDAQWATPLRLHDRLARRYIEGPERELDWFEDGDPQFEQYCQEMIDSVDLALYGRRSYELMLDYWPNAEVNPRSPVDLAFARKMNALPKLVLSRTLEHAALNNTRILRDRVAETITELKRQPGKLIVAWAGAGLVSTLARLGLVDEYRLIVHPVLLGKGTPMFQDLEGRKKLRLTRTTQLGRSLGAGAAVADRARGGGARRGGRGARRAARSGGRRHHSRSPLTTGARGRRAEGRIRLLPRGDRGEPRDDVGAVKAALHRGRGKLLAPEDPPTRSALATRACARMRCEAATCQKRPRSSLRFQRR
jgi:dihydrofolate reductase